MDKIFDTLLTWQFLMFCLGIAAITSVTKTFSDFVFKNKKLKKIQPVWNELVLPIYPIILGSALGHFLSKYPYPGDISTMSGRIFFGMVAGMLSGVVYRLLKSLLLANIKGTEDPNDNLINSVKSKLLNNNNQ